MGSNKLMQKSDNPKETFKLRRFIFLLCHINNVFLSKT